MFIGRKSVKGEDQESGLYRVWKTQSNWQIGERSRLTMIEIIIIIEVQAAVGRH